MASLYELRDIPGKGKGLVATSNIPRGTRILAESPFFKLPRFGLTGGSYQQSIIAKVETMSKKKRKEFYALYNAWPEIGKELGIIKTNALPMGDEGGMFPVASRINHSCAQNAQNTWNSDINKLTIHAIKDIDQGEEITIMYLGEHADYATRQHALKEDHRFECTCERCSLPEADRRISDARLKEIQTLDRSLSNGFSIISSPLKSLHNARRILQLLNTEGIADSSVSLTLYNAFHIAVVHKDLARAKVFAQRSAAARQVNEGKDSVEVKNLERLAKDPALDSSYGEDNKWKTAIDDIPTDLDPVKFENWLWRYESPGDIQLANLRTDENHFPSFEDLPKDALLSHGWYRAKENGYWEPCKHWIFIGEVVNRDSLIHLRLVVQDRAGNELPIAFYTQHHGAELNPSELQVGNTVAIFYAMKHLFMDMTEGIRHEDPEYLKIFPISLDGIMRLSDKIQIHATLMDGMRTCHGCNKKSNKLMKCARCGFFWYCNGGCQVRGWNENGHKGDCKLLRDNDFKGLFTIKWEDFNKHISFPLRVEE
ncbi:SET domain protein [Fusarium beomiforme]|uniref:SET domain protein n=1 Tax=Fusarium beomiforme TaxID=44412 RepID=A0A9P5AET8_9HYPO|nr:SET domain protein [Fusarium beomiforme]